MAVHVATKVYVVQCTEHHPADKISGDRIIGILYCKCCMLVYFNFYCLNEKMGNFFKNCEFFFVFVVWCSMISFHPAKMLVRNTIWALCVVFVDNNTWFLHNENGPDHISLLLRDHFAKNATHFVLAWFCDFWLFPQLCVFRFLHITCALMYS